MRVTVILFILAAPLLCAQDNSNARPPVTKVDLEIVQRARQILDSPAKWNRADNRQCSPKAKTFSLYCALEEATTEKSGQFEHRGAAMQEARFVIEEMAHNLERYNHRLMDYNNDPTTTFADVRRFFNLLEDHVTLLLAGKEVPRKVPAAAPASSVSVPPGPPAPRQPITETDFKILARVRALIDSPAKWDRRDTQACPAGAPTISLFCAFRAASEEIEGRFNNSGAAIQEARALIGEMDAEHQYNARLTDFNNDPAVSFSGLQKFLDQVESRLKARNH